jgi:hypothetical protein
MIKGNPRVLKTPPPLIFVENYNASSGIVMNCSFHASLADLGDIQRTMIEDVKRHLETSSVGSLVPQQIARAVPADADAARFLVLTL